MHIETLPVTKVVISDVPGLDPITVIAEDIQSHFQPSNDGRSIVMRSGKVTISHFDKSWTAYWGNMADSTVHRFFCSACPEYLIECLDSQIKPRVRSADSMIKHARMMIIKCRRGRLPDHPLNGMDEEHARDLFDKVKTRLGGLDADLIGILHADFLGDLFGCEYWNIPDEVSETNHEYTHLKHIVTTIKEAFIKLYPSNK